jgi:L-methionine (R)-S-oxide reductase
VRDKVLAELHRLGEVSSRRPATALNAARLIRAAGRYRWVGLYDVLPTEIAVIAWDGPEAPTYPTFPLTQGLNGAAVATKRAVLVQDVSKDPRYLTTIGGTRGEMIQPVIDHFGKVVGTIDVESDVTDAFGIQDESLLSACAEALSWLWTPSNDSLERTRGE